MRIAMRIHQSCFSSLLMALVLSVAVQPCVAQETKTEQLPGGGTLEKVTDKDGHLVQTRELDKDSQLIKKTVIKPTLAGGEIKEIYDKNGHLDRSSEFDKSGELIHEEWPMSWGSIKSDYTAGRPVESRFYDQEGNLLGRRQAQYDQSGKPMYVTSIYYDDGRKVKHHLIWNWDGNHQLTTYDKDGHPIIQKKAEHSHWSELNSKTGRWDPCDEPEDFATWEGLLPRGPRPTAQSPNDAAKNNPLPPAKGEPPKTSGGDDAIDPEILEGLNKSVGPQSGKKIEDEMHQDKLKKEKEEKEKEKKEKEKNPNKQESGRPVPPPTVATTVGIVVPARGSGMISGIVTTEPESYKGVPGLQVITGSVQLLTTPDGKPTLKNLMVDTGGGLTRPANEPITFLTGSQTQLSLIPAGHPEQNVPLRLNFQPRLPTRPGNEITTSPACFPGNISAVHGMGSFSGDSTRMVVLFGDQRITPIAANEDGFFFKVPADAPQGATKLVFVDRSSQGWWAGATQVGVMTLRTGVGQPLLHKGQRTEGVVTLQAEGIPAEAWQGGVGADPELVDVAAIRQSAPGFEPPREGHPGTILLAIQNQSPETISIAGFKGTTQVYSLSRHSLPFNTRLGIHATRAGSFDINVIVQPFLAPARFQEFRRGSTFTSRP